MGLIHVGRVGSTAVTVSLSIERYLAIRQRDSDISGPFLFWAPIIFSVIYNIPKFFGTYVESGLVAFRWYCMMDCHETSHVSSSKNLGIL